MYLFQNIPIYLTASFFKMIDNIIIPFIWADKPSHISKAHLRKSTAKGGPGLDCLPTRGVTVLNQNRKPCFKGLSTETHLPEPWFIPTLLLPHTRQVSFSSARWLISLSYQIS